MCKRLRWGNRKELRHEINSQATTTATLTGSHWASGIRWLPKNSVSIRRNRAGPFSWPPHPHRRCRWHSEECSFFTVMQLEQVVLFIKDKKVPGPDGIPSKMVKLVHKNKSDRLLNTFNACWTADVFYSPWKVDKLDTTGKLQKRLSKPRLIDLITPTHNSPTQFGFRVGRSTIDAI